MTAVLQRFRFTHSSVCITIRIDTMKAQNKEKGFTIIELLVVVAIIGILTSITMAFLSDAREKSRDSRRFDDLRQIKNALGLYNTDNNGLYPPGSSMTQLTGGGYLQLVPVDPTHTGPYAYSYQGLNGNNVCNSSPCTSYVLKAVLEQDEQEALDVDIDGTLGGVNCDDPAFCIIP